jgi:LemA protein
LSNLKIKAEMFALTLGVLMALSLFWSVGAYNRLVRLRAEVLRQWSSVDAVWLRLLVRLQGGLAARQTLVNESDAQELQGVQTASDLLLDMLMQARIQPLDEVIQKQVLTQHSQLVNEIRLLQQNANHGIRPDLDIALNRMRQTLPAAVIPYHVAVSAYNDALSMRPASWLARQLRFKPAVRMDLTVTTHAASIT